eukprot:Opistho-2@91324
MAGLRALLVALAVALAILAPLQHHCCVDALTQVYVDPANAADGAADGTVAHPFATLALGLSSAVSAAATDNATIVLAAANYITTSAAGFAVSTATPFFVTISSASNSFTDTAIVCGPFASSIGISVTGAVLNFMVKGVSLTNCTNNALRVSGTSVVYASNIRAYANSLEPAILVQNSGKFYIGASEVSGNWRASGKGGAGLSVINGANADVTSVLFKGNNATIGTSTGGAIVVTDTAQLTIRDSFFTQNSASDTGACIGPLLTSTTYVYNTKFWLNTCPQGAAAAPANSALVVFTNCTFLNNTVTDKGGAFHTKDTSRLQVYGSYAFGNSARVAGGFGYFKDSSIVTVSDTTLESNLASSTGGAIFLRYVPVVTMDNVRFLRNGAPLGGGGLYVIATADGKTNGVTFNLTNSLFDSNAGGQGGGLYLASPFETYARLDNVTFYKNIATDAGGGVYLAQLNMRTKFFNNLKFTNNTAATSGGAIYAASNTSIPICTTCTYTTNFASLYGSTMGGAIAKIGWYPNTQASTFGTEVRTGDYLNTTYVQLVDLFNQEVNPGDKYYLNLVFARTYVVPPSASVDPTAIVLGESLRAFINGHILIRDIFVAGLPGKYTIRTTATLAADASVTFNVDHNITVTDCGDGFVRQSLPSYPSYWKCAAAVCSLYGCANGKCNYTDSCICDAGWTGPSCHIALCPAGCKNGKCTSPGVCQCDSLYYSHDCSQSYILNAIVPVVVVVGVVAAILLIRAYRIRAARIGRVWEIPHDDIQFGASKNAKGSSASLAKSLGSLASSNSGADGQIFIKDAMWQTMRVAIKSYRLGSNGVQSNMLREFRILGELRHSNLVTFHGYSISPAMLHTVIEYCERGSLEDVVFNQNIELDWIFKYSLARDAASALQYLHQSELAFHGRLKSSNCIIDGRWVLKLTDFGMESVRSLERDTFIPDNLDNEILRSRIWMSPEILAQTIADAKHTNLPDAMRRSGDIYAFGLLFIQMIDRDTPFSSHDLCEDTLAGVASGKITPTIPDNTPSKLKPLIEMCVSGGDRPSATSVLAHLKKIDPQKGNVTDNMSRMLQRYATNLEGLVQERTQALAEEKKKTELLLYRMLPAAIADDLKIGKKIVAETFDCVTIFFSDIVGFTDIASHSTPLQVVDLLNDLYTSFDSVIDQHDVYKVETIGDAYMVVSGLPQRNANRHAGEIATMALDLLSATTEFRIRHMPDKTLQLRVGMHSGPAVAGVVGLKMPRYCLFGDTV